MLREDLLQDFWEECVSQTPHIAAIPSTCIPRVNRVAFVLFFVFLPYTVVYICVHTHK